MTAVNFPPAVGGDGSTVSDDANPTTGLANGGHQTRFVPALAQVVAVSANTVTKAAEALASATSALNSPGSQATSVSSLTIGIGSKTLTLDQVGKAFVVGQQVIIASTASPTNWMAGTITAFTSGTGAMTVQSILVSGSGTVAAWTISQCGPALPTVLKSGDTMTGPLVLPGDPTTALQAASKSYVDGAYFRSQLQEFAASGTWNKPAGITFALVECWAAGGGGGSGARGAASTYRGAGSGGGGGAYLSKLFDAADLPASVTVTIGLGGAGGAAKVANGSGNDGVNGGNTSFGTILTVYGGGGGLGGVGSSTDRPGGGGGGQLSAGSTTTAGAPLLSSLATAADYQILGGGNVAQAGTTTGQASVYGGGAGGGSLGLSPNSVGTGARSAYGGAGGNCGGSLIGGDVQILPASTLETGYLGSSGAGGLPGLCEVNSAADGRVAYGDGKFLMFSAINTNVAYTSTNASSWSKTEIPRTPLVFSASTFTSFLHDGTRWVGISGNSVYTLSNDFSSGWVLQSSQGDPTFYGLAYNAGTYVQVGSNGQIYTSTNLINWTARTSGTVSTLYDVIHDGTYWLVVGASGRFLRSTDAITWTLVTTASTGNWYRIASNGAGTYVALASTTPFARYSTNSGTSWNAVITTLTGPDQVNSGIVFAESVFSLSSGSNIYYSSDGANWTTTRIAVGAGMAYGNGNFVVGNSDETTTGIVFYSADGITYSTNNGFTFTTAGAAGTSGGIACGGGGGGGASSTSSSGAGGSGGNGFARVLCW